MFFTMYEYVISENAYFVSSSDVLYLEFINVITCKVTIAVK